MISVHHSPRRRRFRWRAPRRPKILAVFSFRYDAHLVPDLIANLQPLTDGWVVYDDTSATDLFSNEVERRVELLKAAREAGADWALAVDPDERYETRLASKIDGLTRRDKPLAYTFAVREMYSPTDFRVDGVWGTKRQARLLNLTQGVIRPEGALHLSWHSFIPKVSLVETPYNLYHLKMIARHRRVARAALYSHLDPDKQMQAIGYDYLADDTDLELARIPPGSEYHPPHREDGGLWMPDLAKTGAGPSCASSS